MPLKPLDRPALLDEDEWLEQACQTVAVKGDSEIPTHPEDGVDFYYFRFVESHQNGHLLRA